MIDFGSIFHELATPGAVLAVYVRLGSIRQALRDHAHEDDARFKALGVGLTVHPQENHT